MEEEYEIDCKVFFCTWLNVFDWHVNRLSCIHFQLFLSLFQQKFKLKCLTKKYKVFFSAPRRLAKNF
jgi:hypothetical protein